jgi:hypothetical protein
MAEDDPWEAQVIAFVGCCRRESACGDIPEACEVDALGATAYVYCFVFEDDDIMV